MSGAPRIPARPGERVTAGWGNVLDPSTRCDRTLLDADAAKACAARITAGGAVWIEDHIFTSPNDAHKSYSVITCEHCHLSEIAHEWADADIPDYKLATGSVRALAGGHLLTADQYRITVGLTKQVLAQRGQTEPKPLASDEKPVANPVGAKSEEELLVRETRKVRDRRETGGGRGGLAG